MLSYILIFSIIVLLLILLTQRETTNEGFKETQNKIKSNYRRAHRNLRQKGNEMYNNISAHGNRLLRRFGI